MRMIYKYIFVFLLIETVTVMIAPAVTTCCSSSSTTSVVTVILRYGSILSTYKIKSVTK